VIEKVSQLSVQVTGDKKSSEIYTNLLTVGIKIRNSDGEIVKEVENQMKAYKTLPTVFIITLFEKEYVVTFFQKPIMRPQTTEERVVSLEKDKLFGIKGDPERPMLSFLAPGDPIPDAWELLWFTLSPKEYFILE
ncbi:MAG: hypothetical protein AAB870_04630, partial [Patescibacteria group bacterium]